MAIDRNWIPYILFKYIFLCYVIFFINKECLCVFMWFQCRLYKRFGCTDVECSGAYFEIAKCSFLFPIFQPNKFSYTRKKKENTLTYSLFLSSHQKAFIARYVRVWCSCLCVCDFSIFFLLLLFIFLGEKWNRLLLVYLHLEKRHIFILVC